MHTMAPSTFIHENLLPNPTVCPECRQQFQTGVGVVYNVPYVENSTKNRLWGLMCFCSTTCVLNWFPRQEMGNA